MKLMENKSLEERINKFLNGSQDENLIDDIKSRTEGNPELRQDLIDHLNANILLKREGEQSLKAQLTQQLLEEGAFPINQSSKSWLKWMLLIVGLGLITVLSIVLFPKESETGKQFAYQDPAVPNVRSIGDGSQLESWKESLHYFEQKDYVMALTELEQIKGDTVFLKRNGDNYKLVYGVSKMRQSEYEKAIVVLGEISTESPYYDQALWYQFLCAYYLGDKNNAMITFTKIEDYQNHYRANQSKQLLESLIW